MAKPKGVSSKFVSLNLLNDNSTITTNSSTGKTFFRKQTTNATFFPCHRIFSCFSPLPSCCCNFFLSLTNKGSSTAG
ncbi:hypothetical protein M378DRAFT_459399 [Amanita muscaria Koide BX008]|uniref:Uncharacterized protein n=1 Tax=Amanita muscaria (strain Koide BX008) TaxID=946122 RepID=A0A0C2X8V4_AMAMK|nr:hypothetical protein M378DRAFT_459399 [Amanita muscaria Koide BX008]